MALSSASASPAAAPAEARPRSFSAKAEPSQVGLGRPFVYEIEVRHDPADTYELPRPVEFGEAAVRKVESTREEEEGEATTRFRIEAALYDRLGDAALPDLVLVARGPEGTRELRIPGAPVTVVSTTQSDELAGMHPPQELRVPSYVVAWIALGVLLATGLGFFGYRRWAAGRVRGADADVPEKSPEERALEALALLEAEALPAGGRGREHYFRLSAIVRAFIEESGGLEALERTSGEVVAALRETPLDGLEIPPFASWLERGDLVRYANASVDIGAASADLAEARELVKGVVSAAAAAAAAAAGLGDGNADRAAPVASSSPDGGSSGAALPVASASGGGDAAPASSAAAGPAPTARSAGKPGARG